MVTILLGNEYLLGLKKLYIILDLPSLDSSSMDTPEMEEVCSVVPVNFKVQESDGEDSSPNIMSKYSVSMEEAAILVK